MPDLRPARPDELPVLLPAVTSSRILDDLEELKLFWAEKPWRVQVTEAGEAAVVDRWREHLDIMVVRGLWCSKRRIRELAEELKAIGAEQGFGEILSPLVPRWEQGLYEAAGLEAVQEILAYRLDRPDRLLPPAPERPEGLTLREGSAADIPSLIDIDRSAFEDFWRYDTETLSRYLHKDRLAVAEFEGEAIGYTLSTVAGDEGVLGRLAVVKDMQGKGIGSVLLHDALKYMGGSGTRWVTLSTQLGNRIARSMYEKAGFTRLPGVMVGLLGKV